MTEAELVTRSKVLYEQILDIRFSNDEMLAFGRAVFNKTPWGALSSSGKLAVFRLMAALATAEARSLAADVGPMPEDEIEGDTDQLPTLEDSSPSTNGDPEADAPPTGPVGTAGPPKL